MIFDDPLPFSEALDQLKAKGLMPTSLSSADIRDTWDADLRQRSMFSARTTKAQILQGYKDELGELISGDTNIATARARMQDLFHSLDYDSEHGHFGTEEDTIIPPAEHGSLRDLSSRGRVDLVLQTNLRQVANFGFKKQGETDFALHAYPCWELVRVYPRKVPRGEKLRKGVIVPAPGEDWPSRWESIGGTFYDGRMIARKDDPIWGEIGSTANFKDGLDANFPPFALNSGYGWRAVPRAECIQLGVIDATTDIQGRRSSMNEGLEAAARFDPEFLKSLRDKLDVVIKNGRAKLAGSTETLLANSRFYARDSHGRFARSAIARDIKQSRKAVRISLSQKRDMPEVLSREKYRIDLDYGRPGNLKAQSDDGYGVSHMAAKHPDDLRKLPVTISRGSLHQHENPAKIYAVHGDHVAILTRKLRNDGNRSVTRLGVTTHLKDAKTARHASARAVLLEAR